MRPLLVGYVSNLGDWRKKEYSARPKILQITSIERSLVLTVVGESQTNGDRALRAAEALVADAKRQGGVLLRSQIERVLDRRKLSPAEGLEVFRILEARQVLASGTKEAVETAKEESSDPSDIEASEEGEQGETKTDDEPSAEALSSIPSDLAEHSLLSHQDEIELGRAVRLGASMQQAIADGSVRRSPRSDEIVRVGLDAREKMTRSNIRLIMKVANQYRGMTTLDEDDLLQEGAIGLMRAVDKFDHTKGFRFSTYAFWWIRQAITRGIADKGETIRVPVHMQEKVSRLRKVIRVLLRFNDNKFPSLKQMADETGWSTDQIQFLLDISRTTHIPILTREKEDRGVSLIDVLADQSPEPSEVACEDEACELIQTVLQDLLPREREIITLRFGLDRVAERTLEEIGQKFNLTRERIRQIEAKALKKLMHPVRRQVLGELLDDAPLTELPAGEINDE
jgi:RNA polymerase primary sigma factor